MLGKVGVAEAAIDDGAAPADVEERLIGFDRLGILLLTEQQVSLLTPGHGEFPIELHRFPEEGHRLRRILAIIRHLSRWQRPSKTLKGFCRGGVTFGKAPPL